MIDTTFIEFFGTPTFVLQPDADGRPIYIAANDAWCRGSGNCASDIVGKTAKQIFGDRFGLIAFKHHCSVVETRENAQYDLLLPFGDKIHTVRTQLNPVLDEAGNVVTIVGSSIDITSELDEFIYMAAHDLRTPMRNIAFLADLLQENLDEIDAEKSKLVSMIKGVSEKASNLITDLLSHAQATSAEEPSETFDAQSLVADILFTLDPLQNHRFVCDARLINSDKAAFQIATRNLLDNAIKHCGRERVEFAITVGPADDEMIEISVTDNGFGFPDATLAFLDDGKIRVDSGFGLHGLLRMISARGGTIAASNLPDNAGGHVRFTLPGHLVEHEIA